MSFQHTPCAVLPRPVLCPVSAPYQICFDLIFFAFSFGFVFVFIVFVFVVAFFCRRTVVSSFRFNKRWFRLPVCRRRRIYTRLLSGRHQGNQGSQQPAATPSPSCSPLCRVIAGRVASRRVCCVFAFIGNVIFDFAGNLISSSAAVQHSRSRWSIYPKKQLQEEQQKRRTTMRSRRRTARQTLLPLTLPLGHVLQIGLNGCQRTKRMSSQQQQQQQQRVTLKRVTIYDY